MRIAVAIKQVPARDSVLKPGAGGWIDESGMAFEINEPDAYALEEALSLAERYGGEVVAVCVGPERASRGIREALAKGAARAIHVEHDDPAGLDVLSTARLLAAALGPEKPDLVLTGLQSEDLGFGQTGVALAELMGFPHATIIMEVSVEGGAARVKRELEDGWFQYLDVPLPAVLAIQSGIRKLRYATLMGIKKAKTKEVKRLRAADLGVALEAGFAVTDLYVPARRGGVEMLTGTPREQASRLFEKLQFEARVL